MSEKPIDRIVERYFGKKITREKARISIEKYIDGKNFSETVLKGLDRRRDHRSRGEFFISLAEGIRKEHASFLSVVKYLERMGNFVKWETYGTDAIGQAFMVNTKNQKKEKNKPDYIISINKSPFFITDVKNCSSEKINTFKKQDLENYDKYNCGMIVCMGRADPVDPDIKKIVIYGNKAVKKLNTFEGKVYRGFAGRKLGVRVGHKGDKDCYITFEELKSDRLIDIVDLSKKRNAINGPLKYMLTRKFNY